MFCRQLLSSYEYGALCCSFSQLITSDFLLPRFELVASVAFFYVASIQIEYQIADEVRSFRLERYVRDKVVDVIHIVLCSSSNTFCYGGNSKGYRSVGCDD